MEREMEEGLYKLSDPKQGELSLKKEWFNLESDKNVLSEIVRNDRKASFLLIAELKNASNLQVN
jgi:hypothetical protein